MNIHKYQPSTRECDEAVARHRLWMKGRWHKEEPKLSNLLISNKTLLRVDTPINMSYSTFFQCLMENSRMKGSDLSAAGFEITTINAVDMTAADLREVEFKECNVKCSNMNGADLCYAKLKYSKFREVDFTGVNLYRAYISGCTFTNCKFDEASLSMTEIRNSTFEYKTSFTGTNLTGAMLVNVGGIDYCSYAAGIGDKVIVVYGVRMEKNRLMYYATIGYEGSHYKQTVDIMSLPDHIRDPAMSHIREYLPPDLQK